MSTAAYIFLCAVVNHFVTRKRLADMQKATGVSVMSGDLGLTWAAKIGRTVAPIIFGMW